MTEWQNDGMTKGNTICPRPFHGGGIKILGRTNFWGAGGDDNLSIKLNWPYSSCYNDVNIACQITLHPYPVSSRFGTSQQIIVSVRCHSCVPLLWVRLRQPLRNQKEIQYYILHFNLISIWISVAFVNKDIKIVLSTVNILFFLQCVLKWGYNFKNITEDIWIFIQY
jgi:hypothetical protein